VEDRCYISTPAMAKQVEEFRPWVAELLKVWPALDVRLFGEGLLYDHILTGQKNNATRESEAAKYVEMYKDPNYGMPEHRVDGIVKILHSRPRGTLLDVGTGRGETLDIADQLGFEAQGTETVDYLVEARANVVHGLLPNLPFPDKEFDTVTCFEVIEHLLPADVLPALRELARLAKDRVIISAATCPDIRGGVNLHPSYRSEYEWEEAFKVAWSVEADVKKIGNLSINNYSPVYEYRLRPSSKPTV
jgi:SAM-dependent methyltransferase